MIGVTGGGLDETGLDGAARSNGFVVVEAEDISDQEGDESADDSDIAPPSSVRETTNSGLEEAARTDALIADAGIPSDRYADRSTNDSSIVLSTCCDRTFEVVLDVATRIDSLIKRIGEAGIPSDRYADGSTDDSVTVLSTCCDGKTFEVVLDEATWTDKSLVDEAGDLFDGGTNKLGDDASVMLCANGGSRSLGKDAVLPRKRWLEADGEVGTSYNE